MIVCSVNIFTIPKRRPQCSDPFFRQVEKTLEELKSTQAQLIQSEKLASLGELTAGIAHEIQNPLNFVNNFSELSVDLAEELKEEFEKLEIEGNDKEFIDELVNDPHCTARGMVHEFDYPGDNPSGILSGSAIKFASGETGLYQRPPKHGEHTAEVLAEFGIEQ